MSISYNLNLYQLNASVHVQTQVYFPGAWLSAFFSGRSIVQFFDVETFSFFFRRSQTLLFCWKELAERQDEFSLSIATAGSCSNIGVAFARARPFQINKVERSSMTRWCAAQRRNRSPIKSPWNSYALHFTLISVKYVQRSPRTDWLMILFLIFFLPKKKRLDPAC